MRIYIDLFKTWFSLGAFTFGGGYAMLPLLEKEVVEKHGWASEEELLDYFAIAQCTPGIIAVNTATFIGYKLKGIMGAIVATLALVTPSVIIITLIAGAISAFEGNVYVEHMLNGIRIAVCVLMSTTLYKMMTKNIKTRLHLIITIIAFVTSYFFKISTAILLVIAILFGIALLKLRELKHD